MTAVPVYLQGLHCPSGRIALKNGTIIQIPPGTILVEWGRDLIEASILAQPAEPLPLPVTPKYTVTSYPPDPSRDATGRRKAIEDPNFIKDTLRPFRGVELSAEALRAHLGHKTSRFSRMVLEKAVALGIAVKADQLFPEKFTISAY